MFVPIPFSVNITTTSKTMRSGEPPDEVIFPAPPHTSRGIEVKLVRIVDIHARAFQVTGNDKLGILGGLGDAPEHTIEAPQMDVLDRVWIPVPEDGGVDEKNRKGSWKQEVTFRSTFSLSCSPSFTSRTMSVKVRLSHLMHSSVQ